MRGTPLARANVYIECRNRSEEADVHVIESFAIFLAKLENNSVRMMKTSLEIYHI